MTNRALRFAVAVLTAVPVLSACSSSPGDAPLFSFSATPPTRAFAVAGKTCGVLSGLAVGRRITTDAAGTAYVAAVCDGEVYVAASRDGAKSFGAPVAIGLVGARLVTVQGGPAGVAYLVATTSDLGGTANFTRTTDFGATWEGPRPLATGVPSTGTMIAVRGDEVFVQLYGTGALTVHRNASRGAGAFEATAIPGSTSVAYSGLFVDSTGRLWSGYDNPQLYLSSSSDGGVTFTASAMVAGASVYYSTWALGADVVWVVGSPFGPELGRAYRILVSAPTVGTFIAGLAAPVATMETAVAVDDAGTAYYAAGSSGGVVLQRALRTDVSFGAATAVDALGRRPSLEAPGDVGIVIVAYEREGEIWTAVQAY